MRRRFWVAWVVVIGLSGRSLAGAGDKDTGKAKSPDVERIMSTAHEECQAMDHLDVLCNRIGPRLTGSDNLTHACEWVRDRFASFGIENARLETWGEFPVGFNRGPWFGRVFQHGSDLRLMSSVKDVSEIPTRGKLLVIVADVDHVLHFRVFDGDGKLVVETDEKRLTEKVRQIEDLRTQLASLWPPHELITSEKERVITAATSILGHTLKPEPKALEFVTMAWTAGTKGAVRGKAVPAPNNQKELDEAKQKGTLAGAWVVMPRAGGSGPRPDPAFRRSLRKELEDAKVAGIVTGAPGELLVTGGAHRISWDKLPAVPTVTLLRKQFDELTGWLKDGKPVTLEFDIRNYFKKGPIKLYNVIADIPGTDLPDEYVIVGGHIDSWDGATGTTDNGTGVATTLEAARILMKSGVKPRRTIRFMLWSGEEQGLLGSAAYVKAHKDLMPKISAVLVHDGGTNYLSGIGATEAILSDFEQVFGPVKELDPKYPFAVRKVAGLRGGGSDHASFLSANVPGFFWRQDGSARYQRTHHTQFDTFDAANPEYQRHSSLVAALGAFGIANLDHLLSREKLRTADNRRLLGVQLDELTIVEVEDDGAGQKGGIKEGDVLLKIDGTKIDDRAALNRLLRAGGPKMVLTVLRGGKEVELNVSWEPPAPAPAPAAAVEKGKE